MKPLRMCMVCRQRAEKEDLIRIVKNKIGEINIDIEAKLQGRGGYICKKAGCIKNAQKRRALERAFSGSVNKEIYDCLLNLAEVENDNE